MKIYQMKLQENVLEKLIKIIPEKIDLKELKDILYQISADFGAERPTDEEVAKILEILDKDKNGTIELKEFQILISDILRAMLEQDKKD